MKKIAITGGIASGKSQVSKIIESLGGFVIYTDKINAQLLSDGEYVNKLGVLFPNAVVNGAVDKAAIRKEILLSDEKRLALNKLAHGEITQRVKKLIEKFDGKTIFCEIPLIVESGMIDFFDEIWCVVADRQTKIKRIAVRDMVSEQDAEKIIDCQKTDEELIAISNTIIQNNGDLNNLKDKVKELYFERVVR